MLNLFDLITPGRLLLKPDPYYQIKKESRPEDKISYGNRFLGSFEVFQYFESINDIDLQIWFYPNGIGREKLDNREERIKITTTISNVVYEKNKPTRLELDFGLPPKYDSVSTGVEFHEGEILVLCRLITGENEHIPLTLKGKDRYYVMNARPYNTLMTYYTERSSIVHNSYKPLKLKGTKDERIIIVDEDNIKNLTRFKLNLN